MHPWCSWCLGGQCLWILAFVVLSDSALAQDVPLLSRETAPATAAPTTTTAPIAAHDGEPLEITAKDSLEWQRDAKKFTARGEALAVKGDSSVAAATLEADYTEPPGGGMKISKVFAHKSVVLTSRESKAYGDEAVYDLDRGYAELTGGDLKLVTPDQTVTARERFEYFVQQGRLSAIGGAKVVRMNDTLEADTVTATMKNDAQGRRVLDTLEARGNVVITTPEEKVTGAYGIYRAASDKAEMSGGVRIVRGPNVLQGERAEVDLATNTSRIFGGAQNASGAAGGAANGGRVRGVFYPGTSKPSTGQLEKPAGSP